MSVLLNPLFILKKLQLDAIKRYGSKLSGRVLDIGCGTRPYRNMIKARLYIGVDELITVRPDVCGSCRPLAFRDGSFDSVICTELLEHVREPEACIAEIARVLKQGGCAYITAPQTWCLHYEPDDYWRFTRYGLEYLLRKSGFDIESVERIGGIFSLVGVRLTDVAWTRLSEGLSFIGSRNAQRIATAMCLGFSLGFYALGVLGDAIDKKDALGWMILAKKI